MNQFFATALAFPTVVLGVPLVIVIGFWLVVAVGGADADALDPDAGDLGGLELEALIDDHYAGEAQTLTSDAEANLLKLAELRGRLTPATERRWHEVKQGYLRDRSLGGSDDDPIGRAVGAVGLLADRVAAVQGAISDAAARLSEPRSGG